MRAKPNRSNRCSDPVLSRRRCLKRVAYSLGIAFVASLLFGATGCKTTDSSKKDPQTIDDFLSADKPGW